MLSHSVPSDSLQPPGLSPTRLLSPWDSPDKNTGVGCHSLLQGILQSQESKQGLLPFRPGKPKRRTRESQKDKNRGVRESEQVLTECLDLDIPDSH